MLESAYAAGVFDADGCVGIYEAMKHDVHRRYVRLQVMVANNHSGMLLMFKDRYGGSVCYAGAICKQWRQDSRDKVRLFLDDIYPYSIVKRDQIEVALRFLSIPKGSRGLADRELRTSLRLEIARLKQEVPT